MRKVFLFTASVITSLFAMAQVDVTNGPNLTNDRDLKMNRMLGGDENSFYCYRIRSKGSGTSYVIEKYDKETMKPEFSKEFPVDEVNKTKVEDVQYAANTVYIFIRSYDKAADRMTLYYLTVSKDGDVSKKKTDILKITSDHYEFVDFEIYPNPSRTKFVIKAFHKASKEDDYETDFILMDAKDMKKLWTKTLDSKVGGKTKSVQFTFTGGLGFSDDDIGFIGLFLDDKDNIYFASSYYAKNSTTKEKRYKASVSILEADAQEPKVTELTFEDDYLVKDVEFSMTPNNSLVVGGFIKDVIERKGADLVKVGIFSFNIDITTGAIISKAVKMFDNKILMALESSPKKSKYFKYKMDYIFAIGSDIYFVGEQYSETRVDNNSTGMGVPGTTLTTYDYIYEYMDVIVAKLNSKGQFEWVKNTPLRNNLRLSNFSHVFKQYIAVATSKAIYILNNDHEKNIKIYEKGDFEPKDLKSMSGIHGSNFTYSSISLSDGSIKHDLIFVNEDYCFAPIQERNLQFVPPPSTEIFIQGKGNTIYIYTEDRGKDRFSQITFE